jgi:predicted protein tyrosine phosphatase
MTPPGEIRVSAMFDGRLGRDLTAFAPTHVVSLLDPTLAPERRPVFASGPKVFQRSFFDVEDETDEGPEHAVVRELVAFLAETASPGARLLSHCHMGASRSTAAAFIALNLRHGPGDEADALMELLRITNKPWPNRRLVALADDEMARGGAMTAALDGYRDAYPRRIDAYRRLNGRRGLYR